MVKTFRNMSLTRQALFISVAAGLVIWALMEWFHSTSLDQFLDRELNQRLNQQQSVLQQRFYTTVERHAQMVKLFANSEPVAHFLSGKYSNEQYASWVPDIDHWRSIILPSAFFLYNTQGQMVDHWKIHQSLDIPAIFVTDFVELLNKSQNRTLITEIDDRPVLIASAPVIYQQSSVGHIVIYTPIDAHFINLTLTHSLPEGSSVVLFHGSYGHLKVWASSHPEKIPTGTKSTALESDYLFGGHGFFDQGDWLLQGQLSVLIPRSSLGTLYSDLTQLSRQQRLISAVVFVLLFIAIMLFLTQRLLSIAQSIHRFAEHELKTRLPVNNEVNPIELLRKSFGALSTQVKQSRRVIQREHDLEKQIGQLQVLQITTNVLQVGVLKKQADQWNPINDAMHHILDACGHIEHFTHTTSDQIDILDKNGQRRIYELIKTRDVSGELLLVRDITELAIKTEELTHMALYDSLTGIPNRVLFNDRIEQIISTASRENTVFSLLLLDLDSFKSINEGFGHSAGDALLVDVAYRLSQHLRGRDTIARLGGDEFAILLPETDLRKAKLVATKLIDAQRVPYQLGNSHIDVSTSIGIVCYPKHGDNLEQLMSRADMAMYEAKRCHLGHFVYQPEIDFSDHDRLTLQAELRHAIQNNELEIYYQPQVSLSSLKAVSWEALIRWQHPTRGMIFPDQFIPMAEETGLIRDITRFVIDHAIADCARWRQQGIDGGLSINLSTQDFSSTGLVDRISQQLRKHQLAGELLTLEITESALMNDPSATRRLLEQLNVQDIHISIDDFGTGYSSLSYLKQLPISEIKIDKIFVQHMQKDDNDAAIVRAVISLARSLNMNVVAEGVEDEDTMKSLMLLQCSLAQGYLFSRPVPFDNIQHFTTDDIKPSWLDNVTNIRPFNPMH